MTSTNTRRLTICLGSLLTNLFIFGIAQANNFKLPPPDQSLIGDIEFTRVAYGDTPAHVAQRYNLGLNAIVSANPGVQEQSVFPSSMSIKVAGQFLLPPLPRRGIVINLPEMRLYYYPDNSNEVMTFPIGIGKIGKTIPIANTVITKKVVNPTWTPPEDIRKFNEEQGIDLPKVMPAGPDNPLGPYAMYLRIPTFLIHSTIFPESIGRRASFGCIRMNETDIKQFFPLVDSGTPVTIIDMPHKIAWQGDSLYIESHEPLLERSTADYARPEGLTRIIADKIPRKGVTLVNWQMLADLTEEPDGIPHEIGVKIN